MLITTGMQAQWRAATATPATIAVAASALQGGSDVPPLQDNTTAKPEATGADTLIPPTVDLEDLAEVTHAVSDDIDSLLLAAATAIEQPAPLRVMIDPGHGGSDPGAIAHNGLREKDLTLEIAQRVQRFLAEIDDIEVLTTRDTDVGMSRQDRVTRIRESDADLMVSIHFNHLPQRNVNLVETYYADEHNIAESLHAQSRDTSTGAVPVSFVGRVKPAMARQSRQIAELLQQHVYREVSHQNDIVGNAGVKPETLFVLTRSFTAGALIEMACISYPEEADRLEDEAYRNRLAASIADAIRDYKAQRDRDSAV